MKKPVVSILVLVLLVVVYLLVEHQRSSNVAPKLVDNFLGVDTTEVTKITIGRLGSALTLEKVAGEWYVMQDEPHKTEANMMQQLLNILGEMKVGNVISDNPSNQIKFQVDTLTGFTVSIYSGDDILSSVVIGKMADYTHTYVRLVDENEVYIAEGMMSHLMNRPPADWRDKTILDLDPNQIQAVEIRFGDQRYAITRADTVWQLQAEATDEVVAVDQDKAIELINSLSSLKADGFATEMDEYDFSEIGYSAKITLSDGGVNLIEAAIFDEETGRYFLRIPEIKSIFVLYDSSWKNIAKSYDDLLPIEKNS
jgi:hypothetical protein